MSALMFILTIHDPGNRVLFLQICMIVFIQWLVFTHFGYMCYFDSRQGSSVCSLYQEGLGVWMVGQVPPCTLHPTICVSQVQHRVECPQLSQDLTDSSTHPWCSLSYRDRSIWALTGATVLKQKKDVICLFLSQLILVFVSHACCCLFWINWNSIDTQGEIGLAKQHT